MTESTQHPLTETAATQMWSTASRIVWIGLPAIYRQGTITALRAAFDAGREHEREHAAQDRTAEITDEMVEAAARATHSAAAWPSTPGIIKDCWRRYARAALSAALAATAAEPLARTLLGVPAGHGAPHHDAGRIKPGDFVLQVDESGYIHAGIAHHQDEEGDWLSEDDNLITWAARRADRPDAVTVWPAPTPPAVEVKVPRTPGDVVRDIHVGPHRYEFAVKLHDGWRAYQGPDYALHPDHEGAFLRTLDMDELTLPDGTRARRDGERPDGKPRFVKVQEGEK